MVCFQHFKDYGCKLRDSFKLIFKFTSNDV